MKAIEKVVTSLIFIGFAIFGFGALFSIVRQSYKYRMPIELTIILVGLVIILLGMLAAKLFSEVSFDE